MLNILLLTSLLNAFNGNIVGPPLPNIEPLQELVEKRAFVLQTKLEPGDSNQIALSAMNVGEEAHLSPLLILAIIEIESRYDKKAKSKKGCKGLAQLSKFTGRNMASKLGMKKYSTFDIYDNIKIGTSFLVEILKQFPKLVTALTIYNKGYGTWVKNPKTSNYAYAIKSRYNYLKSIYKERLVCGK